MKCSWELGNILDGQTVKIYGDESVWTVAFLNVQMVFMALHLLKAGAESQIGKKKKKKSIKFMNLLSAG